MLRPVSQTGFPHCLTPMRLRDTDMVGSILRFQRYLRGGRLPQEAGNRAISQTGLQIASWGKIQ